MPTPMNSNLLPRFKSILFLWLLICCVNELHAQSPVKWNSQEFTLIDTPRILISDSLNIKNAIASDSLFETVKSKSLNLMYQHQPVFALIKARAEQDMNEALFAVNYPLFTNTELQVIINKKEVIKAIELKTPIESREIVSQYFAYRLPLIKQGDTLSFLLKVEGEFPITMPMELATQKRYLAQNSLNNIVLAIYLGLMLSIFLYNLFVYLSVKDRNYLYYVLYILSITIAQLGLSGFLIRFVLPDAIYNSDIIVVSSVIAGISAIKFASKFIQLSKYANRLNKGLIPFYAGYIAVFISYYLNQHNAAFRLLDILGAGVSLYALWFSVRVSAKGYRPAKFFLIAWSFFIVGLITFVLKSYGVLPNTVFTNAALQWGSAVEALLLSFALADRINILKKEKEQSQAAALFAAQENERIIKEQNITLEQKVTERTKELKNTNDELNKTLVDLKETQSQLVESEKMASLGQLTAGIAHEINNPINFVTSNVKPLKRDVDLLIDLVNKLEIIAKSNKNEEQKAIEIEELKATFDFDYLQEEITYLLKGINEGSTRTAEIVKGLRIFSRVDEDDIKRADINEGLDSTIIIINNLLNGRITIEKNYGNIPLAECYPGKLNQVFLNLITNAIYAVNAQFNHQPGGLIRIETESTGNTIIIRMIDNGIGMNESTLKKLFEPFFTTKPVGEGTGLGLSISYNTIKKHNGTISVASTPSVGTTFIIEIPIIQPNS